jgi:hypothetical protein
MFLISSGIILLWSCEIDVGEGGSESCGIGESRTSFIADKEHNLCPTSAHEA